ncbi:Stk1 family PASTA domain-containing Ser/Thr kinase [Pontibacillus yanchengensis]|uniref:Serine/threonine-protein kinase PrkC n=1 Tax=Pontibacillus yanchengensis Y32 TaxID=1385514 RepID=A0A0A2TEH8_9BACI|nr:Stk1 family PASTA domain-containing Ser/Thr kinase [Pontibacillus yanchengensis]KGP73944.1 serine/threonine protein kinase [Pontibacillus yanchengensis Y32]
MLKGHLLNERYEIQDMIGGGGMANVYLGKDTILNRNVAIKVLRLEYANDEEFIARFRREAHSATSLSHPNIVNIYDVGEEEHIYYMVMEYVDGMTLKQYIQTYGPAEVEEAIEITKQITAAMSHAHENDIVHRDIKPQNILIDEHKHVKVTDFGIAIALSATSLTQTNSVLGSVHYLSPEQARGGMATKKSDIYSIGIVLFELLTGRLPFSGQSAVSIALKHLQSETPSLMRWNPSVPQSVENIVLKATAKDPFHRYDDIYDMVDDLETALHPDRQNEEKFETPIEDDEEVTKAIPIITNDMYKNDEPVEDTIVHDTDHTSTITTPPKKKGKWKGWVFGLLILIIGVGSLAVFLLPKLLIPNDVEVVDVKGMKYEEAYSTLSELNLDVSQETMYSEDVPEGNVVRSEPNAGSTIKEGSQVKIYTSLGKERVSFEDYLGQNFSQVEKMLKEKGYKIIAYKQHSEKSEGEIIGQVQPNPGDKVIPEETSVIFEVSDGPEQVQVSKLVGDYLQEVYDYIDQDKRISLKEPQYEYSDSVPEGVVIRQKPEAYARVTPGTEVTVWVSRGKKEQAPVNKDVSFAVELDEEQTGQEHEVKIYVDDVNRNGSEVYEKYTITETAQYELTLTIAEGQEATYRVMLDDEVYLEESVPYEEGE